MRCQRQIAGLIALGVANSLAPTAALEQDITDAKGEKQTLQVMKELHRLKPKLFKKQHYYLPGCDTYQDVICRHSKNIFRIM